LRLIAIGDIHGHLGKLGPLLGIVQPTEKDRLVFLGDYIDRGPNCAKLIDYLICLADRWPGTVFLRGNHEQLMLDALAEEAPDRLPGWKRLADLDVRYHTSTQHLKDARIWIGNEARATLLSYGATEDRIRQYPLPWDAIPQEHVDFLARTKFWHRQDGFLFCHAGVMESSRLPLEKQIGNLLWERYCPPGETEIHVVGHHPTPDGQPFFEEGRYSLDTGAGNRKLLTACDVLTKEFWQA
jgi:serine/threonine protein phosphatase 1